MSGIISGMMRGVGEAGLQLTNKYADYLERSALQKEAEEAQRLRDERLQAFQTTENEKNRALTREEGAATRQLTRDEGAATRAHQSTEALLTREHQTAEAALTRETQRRLAEMHERGADRRHGASIALQREQLRATMESTALQPLPDGRIARVDKRGQVVGYLTDPATGTELVGPKNISDGAKLLMTNNSTVIAALEKASAEPGTTSEQRADLTRTIERLRQENHRLAGVSDGPRPEAAQPTDAHIKALRDRSSDPRAKAAFDQQFGPGAADRVLGAKDDKKPPTPPAASGDKPAQPAGASIVGSRMSQMEENRARLENAERARQVTEKRAEVEDLRSRLESGNTTVSGRDQRGSLETRLKAAEKELAVLESSTPR